MKFLVASFYIASALWIIACGKDDKGSGGTVATANNYQYQPHQADTSICANARYQSGRWFDYNGVELPQCLGISNYMNSQYLFGYDNSYCSTVVYNNQPTVHLIVNGENRCASSEYFQELGQNQVQPQPGKTHYLGYAPPSYYNYNSGGYLGYGFNPYGYYGHQGYNYNPNTGLYCSGWGCDIGDGKWNFGDFAAIALGAGLIFAIANQ